MTSGVEASALRADLLEKLAAHHEEMVEVVKRLSDAEARTPPQPGEWSALQQIEHQMLGEDIWSSMAAKAATEDEPDLSELWAKYRIVEEQNPFPPPAEPRTLDELLVALEERRAQTLALIASIPDEAFQRVGRNTGWGDMSVIQMLRALYRHYRMHIDQIQGKASAFQPRRTDSGGAQAPPLSSFAQRMGEEGAAAPR